MKVLLATDGSPQSEVALQTAATLLRKERAEFDLLYVAPDFSPPKARIGRGAEERERMIESYRAQARAQARDLLARAQASLAEKGIEAGARTEIGSPARVIVELAGEYDMTVVGAHDRYARSKPGLGPVASRVVASAPNAAMVGREATSDTAWRVLIAVDGSLASERALNLAAAYFRLQSAEITLMSVIETPWIRLGFDRESFDYREKMGGDEIKTMFESEMRYGAEEIIETSRSSLERHGLSADTVITEGDPALEIISEAERGEYDLIALGATGESNLKRAMLGSVSTKVAQDAPCSVLVAKFIE